MHTQHPPPFISCCFPKSFLLPFSQLNMFASKWKQLPENIHQQYRLDREDPCRLLCCPVAEVCLKLSHLYVRKAILHSGPFTSCSASALLLFQLFEVLQSIFLSSHPPCPSEKPWAFSPGKESPHI